MQVKCSCETMVDVTVIGGQYQYTYEGTCLKCGHTWQLVDISAHVDEFDENNLEVIK